MVRDSIILEHPGGNDQGHNLSITAYDECVDIHIGNTDSGHGVEVRGEALEKLKEFFKKNI